MSSKTKHLITSVILAIAILLVLLIFLGLGISLIGAVLVGSATFWWFSSKNDGKPDSEEEKQPLSVTEVSNQALLMANLALRKTIVSPQLRENYETLIDLLIELLPLVNDSELESELSWVINRMATEYLPNKSINPYLKLSDTERLDSQIVSEVLENINAMKKELLDVKEMIIKKNSGEFSQKAKFLKQRFPD